MGLPQGKVTAQRLAVLWLTAPFTLSFCSPDYMARLKR